MINKQSLWFITLFSLVLILGIYYVAMPKDSLATFTGNLNDTSQAIEVSESDVIIAMKVEQEEKLLAQIDEAQKNLLNSTASIEERNIAYELLQNLNNQKSKIESIEKIIKEKYGLISCVKIENTNIVITVDSKDLGTEFANKIISTVQNEFEKQMYITIQFKN